MSEVLLTEWSRLLFGALFDAGVRDIVVCPGARSLPFALAAVNHGRLRIHLSVDERAAGFFALGQARITGSPSVVLCTSGSAGAHFFPAIVEAAAARLPLIVMTADRPNELQECGAAQTMDQLKLFGDHVRQFFEVGLPDLSNGALRGLRRIAAQAVLVTNYPDPGPVHMNLRARKPLEPPRQISPQGQLDAELVQAEGRRPLVVAEAPTALASVRVLRKAATLIGSVLRGAIVCGPMLHVDEKLAEAVQALARHTGFPIFAEATSQLRFRAQADGALSCEAFDRLLQPSAFLRANLPELVIQIGAPPSSLRWEAFLNGHPELQLITFTEHGWSDPANMAAIMVLGHLGTALSQLVGMLVESRHTASSETHRFAQAFAAANESAWEIVDEHLRNREGLSEGAAMRTVIGALPQQSLLFVGNSLPIRLLDGFCRSGPVLRVLSQRGVNGIDGNLAGALGSAVCAQLPTTVVLGDLSFLHDLTGLACTPSDLTKPFVVVVLQNYGGRIFEQLPVHAHADVHEKRVILTPHERPVEPAAALFGGVFQHVDNAAALETAVLQAHRRPGLSIIEAVVPPHGAAADARAIDTRVRARLEMA